MRICLVKKAMNGLDAMFLCQKETGFDPDIAFCIGEGIFLCTDEEGAEWKRKNIK